MSKNQKIMGMLEKMGYVQKVEDEDSSYVPAENETVPETRASVPMETMPLPKEVPVRAPEPPQYKIEKPQAPAERPNDISSFWDNTPTPAPKPDRFMEIDELYQSFGMRIGGTDTIYLIEDYIKTLPASLPAELRRSIILKIVSTSGFDFDKLLSDGIDRVSRLNDYSNTFASHTESYVNGKAEEIAALERQIAELHDDINERKNLHKRQFLAIENEGQRLKEILDFITK